MLCTIGNVDRNLSRRDSISIKVCKVLVKTNTLNYIINKYYVKE